MGANSTAGSGSAFSSRLTQNPSGHSAAARHNSDFILPSHVSGGLRPRLKGRNKRSVPSFQSRQERRHAAAHTEILARGGAPTNGTTVDTSQWNIGRLVSEVQRLSQGNCSLYDTYPGPNIKTRIADLPIIYPFEPCRLMAKLAPPNATQLRFVQADAMLDYVNSYYDPIDDLASLRPFRNSTDLIGQLAPLFRGSEKLCIGVYPSTAYAAVEQWLARLAVPRLYRDVLYVHATPQPATEPQLGPRGSQLNTNGGALAVGLGLALWGGLTGFVLKLTKSCWGPRLHEALSAYGCSSPCCNLQAVDDEEEEESVVREFLGQYGYTLSDCDPEPSQDEAASDSASHAAPSPSPPPGAGPEASTSTSTATATSTRTTTTNMTQTPVPAQARMTARPRSPTEDSIESLVSIDLDN